MDGRVCDVRADFGSLVALKFLFGFVNRRFSFSLVCSFYVGIVIPKHYPHSREFTLFLFPPSADSNMSSSGYKNRYYLTC